MELLNRVMKSEIVSKFMDWAVGPYGQSEMCLGLYYDEQAVKAVRVEKQDQGYRIFPLNEVKVAAATESSDETEDAELEEAVLPNLAAALQSLAADPALSHGPTLAPLLALDSCLYHTQLYHSDFENSLQIDQTLSFDVEEDSLFDSESTFLCYKKLPTASEGSDLLVFSTQREGFENLTTCFEQNELDCLSIEPDCVSWHHYLTSQGQLASDEAAMVLGRSEKNLYVLITNNEQEPVFLRSYYCPIEDDISETLVGELRRCLTLIPQDQHPTKLWIHRGGFSGNQIKRLEEDLSFSATALDEPDIGRAFAAGVAIGWLEKNASVDFRKDSLVPVTFQRVEKKAWLGLSAVATVFFVFILFVVKLHSHQSYVVSRDAQEAMLSTFQLAYPGQNPPLERIPRIIGGRLRTLQTSNQQQSSQTLASSSSHTFYLLIEALDSLPSKFDLAIDTMRVGNNGVDLSGSVANIDDQVKLDEAFKQDGRFIIDKWDLGLASSNRRSFNMSLRVNRSLGKPRARKSGK